MLSILFLLYIFCYTHEKCSSKGSNRTDVPESSEDGANKFAGKYRFCDIRYLLRGCNSYKSKAAGSRPSIFGHSGLSTEPRVDKRLLMDKSLNRKVLSGYDAIAFYNGAFSHLRAAMMGDFLFYASLFQASPVFTLTLIRQSELHFGRRKKIYPTQLGGRLP